MIAVDEFEYVGEDLIKEVIFPMFEVKNTAMVGATTPRGKMTFRTALSEMKTSSGKEIFINHSVGLLCKRCELQNLNDCPHLNYTSSWKDKERGTEIVGALYAGDPMLRKRESRGLAADCENVIFRAEWIRQLIDNPTLSLDYFPADHPFIFTTMDPGAGESSIAILSTIRSRGIVVVSG